MVLRILLLFTSTYFVLLRTYFVFFIVYSFSDVIITFPSYLEVIMFSASMQLCADSTLRSASH